eukprot:353510-Chlamydomonas_euryale.AAC.7
MPACPQPTTHVARQPRLSSAFSAARRFAGERASPPDRRRGLHPMRGTGRTAVLPRRRCRLGQTVPNRSSRGRPTPAVPVAARKRGEKVETAGTTCRRCRRRSRGSSYSSNPRTRLWGKEAKARSTKYQVSMRYVRKTWARFNNDETRRDRQKAAESSVGCCVPFLIGSLVAPQGRQQSYCKLVDAHRVYTGSLRVALSACSVVAVLPPDTLLLASLLQFHAGVPMLCPLHRCTARQSGWH